MALEKEIKSMLKSIDLDLYDTQLVSENGETIYRVNIVEKESSLSLQRCVEATKLISPLLDTEPPVNGEYRLEVGSPGIERQLKSLDHFESSIGEMVKITLNDKSKLRAKLVGVDGEKIELDIDSERTVLNYPDILKASTYFEW